MVASFVPPTPAVEHLILLRTLADCSPGTGYVVGNPGPATLQVFEDCLTCGWVESVSFGGVNVWKITRSGRSACIYGTSINAFPTIAAEC